MFHIRGFLEEPNNVTAQIIHICTYITFMNQALLDALQNIFCQYYIQPFFFSMDIKDITPLNVQLNTGISTLVQYVQHSVYTNMKDLFKRIVTAQCEESRNYLRLSLSLLAVNPGAAHLLGYGKLTIIKKTTNDVFQKF